VKIKNYEFVVQQLRLCLRKYLEERGIDASRNFHCLNPDHQDDHPSANLMDDDSPIVYCFTCGEGANIFKVAHWLENRPLVGKAFITETLLPLAKKYDIELDSTPLTEEEIYELDTYRAYRFAYDYIVLNANKLEHFNTVLAQREWSPENCATHGVGAIRDYRAFREHLKNLGFAATFLDNIDLNRTDIFNDTSLIFAIKDEYGRPVGFSSRNLKYTDDKSNGSKYVNTGAKCGIYKKSTRLFGFDRLLKNHKDKDIVYLFEGYGDTVTATHYGVHNTVAIGGVNLSHEQIQTLKNFGYYNICLVLDGDEAGQNRAMDILDKVLSNQKDLRVSLIILPSGYDPDDFFRAYSANDFLDLKHWPAFEWRLAQFPTGIEPEVVCEKTIPIIANESSAVQREKMEHVLADYTHVSLGSIHKDVEVLINSKEIQKERERSLILDRLRYSIDRNSADAETALTEASYALVELSKRYNEDAFSEEQYLADLLTQKEEEEAKDGSFSGFVLGKHLKQFQEALCGNWRQDTWICIGGVENSGKSSLVLDLSMSIAVNEINNAICIYHSIDDTKAQLLPRCVCIANKDRKLRINQVVDPNYYISNGISNKNILEHRDRGYEKLFQLGRDGRFVMKDANDGLSLAYIEKLISYYKDKYPARNLVYTLDNFHKLQDFQSASRGDERTRFKTISGIIKNLATKYHCCILSTVEYPKIPRGQTANNNSIGETKKIAYDANVICHVYNDLHEYGDRATHYHMGLDIMGQPIMMPRVSITFGKNKVSAYKGTQWYDFWPEHVDFQYVDASVIADAVSKKSGRPKDRFEAVLDGISEE
jgi:DNA primase catalytic core